MDEQVVLRKQGQVDRTELLRSICGMDDSVGQSRQTGKRPDFPSYGVPQFFVNQTFHSFLDRLFLHSSCISKILQAVIGFTINLSWRIIVHT